MNERVVVAQGLTKSYGELIAVNGIDFEVRRGECYGFLGPNGAGKTSTMKMMVGLSPISSGRLEIFGLSAADHSRAIRRKSGVVPQEDSLDPDFTALENLLVYASYFGLRGAVAQKRAEAQLALVGLWDKRDVRVPALSGGMKRRLVLARALLHEPELLLLDEPTTGLDPQARHVIWQALRYLLNQGTTMVLTTHYMDEAAQLCARLCVMDRGSIVTEGTPNGLIASHVAPEVVEIRVGSDGDAKRAHEVLSDQQQEQAGDTLFVYCQSGSEVVARIESELGLPYLRRPANLEDVFLRLTGRALRQ